MNAKHLSLFQRVVGSVISLKIVLVVLVVSSIVATGSVAHAQPEAVPVNEKPEGFLNLSVRTGGGCLLYTSPSPRD